MAGDCAAVVAAVFAEADRRDPAHERRRIALADGNKDQIAQIKAHAAARGITVTIIVDLIHVTEYLRDAAWCLFPKASPDAGGWVRARTAQILDGGPAGAAAVAAALRQAAAGLGKTRRATAARTAGYLDAKAPYLDYPQALAAGWPIATGVIEGACRHLVKDRMDITGARWGVQTAEAILQLRALTANGDFDAYWTWHLQREHERNYPPATPSPPDAPRKGNAPMEHRCRYRRAGRVTGGATGTDAAAGTRMTAARMTATSAMENR